MSWSLVNQGLELLNSDSYSKDFDTVRNKPSSAKEKSSLFRVQKQKSKLKSKPNKSLNFSNANINTLLKEYEASKSIDRAAQNIRKLKRIDDNLDKDANLEQVRKHQLETLKKSRSDADVIPLASESGTVFTEEDFEKMNDEWLNLL